MTGRASFELDILVSYSSPFLSSLLVMMTVSAFGSSMALVCPVAVLVSGSRLAAVHDVNSRYLNLYTSDIGLFSSSFLQFLSRFKLTNCVSQISLIFFNTVAKLTSTQRRIKACDLPEKYDVLAEEFKDRVR